MRHVSAQFFQFGAATRYPTMSEPLMDGAFVGVEGDAQFFEDRFKPGVDFLYGHGSFSPFCFGEAARMANGKRQGEMVPAPLHGSQQHGTAFMHQAQGRFGGPDIDDRHVAGDLSSFFLQKLADGKQGHAINGDRGGI